MSRQDAKSETKWVFASGLELESSATDPASSALGRAGPRLGSSWGPFRIEAVLGRGASACVYRVRFQGEELALKVLFNATERSEQRLAREARVVGQLRHPAIVSLRGAGEVGGSPFVLYELVPEARTLSSAWAGLSTSARVDLVARVAAAMGYAHSCGVLHRDLKPANVLVDADGAPRVVDFGLATHEGAPDLTQEGSWVGTPSYMAPEQFESLREAQTPAVDVWSLGVLLYEALTERLPFHGGSVLELATQVLDREPAPPGRFNTDVSAELEAVCLQALSKPAEERFPNALAFAQALRAANSARVARARWPLAVGAVAAIAVVVVALAAVWVGAADPPAPAGAEQPELNPFDTLSVWDALRDWGPADTVRRAEARLEQDPTDTKARLALAAAHLELKQYEVVLLECSRVLELDPDHPIALDLLANSSYSVGDLATAATAATRGLELDESRVSLWVIKSLLATDTGDGAQAELLAQRALELQPDRAGALAARGLALDLLGRPHEAFEYFTLALEREENVQVRFSRGRVLLVLGRDREALDDFDALLAQHPEDQAALCLRVRALANLDPDAALFPALTVVERFPENAQAFLALGIVYHRLGRRAEAQQALTRCVALDTQGSFAAVAQPLLDGLEGR